MQQAKKDAANNWRTTLSGGGAQMKNNIEKARQEGDIRDQRVDDGYGANDNNNKKRVPVGDQQPAVGAEVQERARKDRQVVTSSIAPMAGWLFEIHVHVYSNFTLFL